MTGEVLAEARKLKKYFAVNRGMLGHHVTGVVKAVDDVNFKIYRGETIGFIGESGCGKSTLARVMLGLTPATAGEALFEGQVIDPKHMGSLRSRISMVFQDPYSSIDPRMNVRRIIEEPLRIHTNLDKKGKRERLIPLIEGLGFSEEDMVKYPHEFSGGQRQRIGIARAFIMDPDFVICDEPVSALDVSIQAQILNLFKKLQREKGTTYMFISHDMSVIKHMSDRIAVMYLGRIVELADKKALFDDTLHPYTKALMRAIPVPNPDSKGSIRLLEGELPSPLDPPSGCPFRMRCEHACDKCAQVAPALTEVKPGHFVACHLFGEEGTKC